MPLCNCLALSEASGHLLRDVGLRCAAEVDNRKRLFAEHLLAYVPLSTLIRRALDDRPSHHAPFTRFSGELENYMS
ncbi:MULTISPECIES: AAA-associated domain-containing protein [Ensifer]|uniref:AAA-associated domain-containing protein n=1 Tax=Ensifer adhaerens TaxID=106592 RepID=A0ABY8HPX6_ENSAD|nr:MULTISPECIES: AAA-associated domain-containing protein [Ensifer]WFP94175.1 AAA-associated domain-containing protein [Ensifer adhaerens]